jgi:hypothetical protein
VVFNRVSRDRVIGLLALVALAPVMLFVPPLAVATTAMAILMGIAIADAASGRSRPSVPERRLVHLFDPNDFRWTVSGADCCLHGWTVAGIAKGRHRSLQPPPIAVATYPQGIGKVVLSWPGWC